MYTHLCINLDLRTTIEEIEGLYVSYNLDIINRNKGIGE